MTLISSVGGAAGPLYGTLFLQMGTSAAGKEELDLDGWTAALEAGVKGVQARGKAEPGDKTMVDALLPAVEALRRQATASSARRCERSADAAEEGMKATIPLEARKGRASYLGPRSVGHQDPGATSSYLLLRAAARNAGLSRGPVPGSDPVDRARRRDPPASVGARRGDSASASWPASSGLPKGTVHGILRTLQLVGFVEQDAESGKYQLGAALLHMGSSYLDGNELRTRALNWADSLAARSQRERAHRDAAREPGARRPPRVPARRQPPGARGRRAAARPRDRARQGAAGAQPVRDRGADRTPG